jgi:hypothetical protein
MPVRFLTPEQRENYARYSGSPMPEELRRFFHLNDDDLAQIKSCRGEHNRLGLAVQLSTVRFLGTFLDDPVAVPSPVVQTLALQLGIISNPDTLGAYRAGKQRWEHVAQIRDHFGYSDITEPLVAFRLTRWLYALCWSGTERPSVLLTVPLPGYWRTKSCCQVAVRSNDLWSVSAAASRPECGAC